MTAICLENLSISSARYLSCAFLTDFSVIIEVFKCASKSFNYLLNPSLGEPVLPDPPPTYPLSILL